MLQGRCVLVARMHDLTDVGLESVLDHQRLLLFTQECHAWGALRYWILILSWECPCLLSTAQVTNPAAEMQL